MAIIISFWFSIFLTSNIFDEISLFNSYTRGNFIMGQIGPRPVKSRPWADYIPWAKHRMKRQNMSEPRLSARLDHQTWPMLGTGLSLDRFFLGFCNEKSKLSWNIIYLNYNKKLFSGLGAKNVLIGTLLFYIYMH